MRISWKFWTWFQKKEETFILTKKRGRGGNLVLRVEEQVGTAYKCSKGSFTVKNLKLTWTPKGEFINISEGNIANYLSAKEADRKLNEILHGNGVGNSSNNSNRGTKKGF